MQRSAKKILLILGTALVAALAVYLEPIVTTWLKDRQATLPLILCLLLTSLLHPKIRHLLVSTLCFGVSFLALRDVFDARKQYLPPMMDYDFINQIRPVALLLVSALAATAAVAEIVRPGTVWARRCYFGAASLYFMGMGIVTYGWHSSWQSVILCLTGITAFFGCLFAHRIVAAEAAEAEEGSLSDETLQQEREAAHQRALQAKEWQDPSTPTASPR